MPENESQRQDIDWRLTSFEGSRREQLRRWAQLPLERMIAALEEMQELKDMFSQSPVTENAVREPQDDYDAGTGLEIGSDRNCVSPGSGEHGKKNKNNP